MMKSMFSSVSGMRAHQTKMDVIGNNIANVNTVGFKGSRVTFSEVFSQTLSGAGAPDSSTGRGGTNPVQIGLGMSVNAVDTLTARGSVQSTDSPTDVSIEGEGFFIVRNGTDGVYQFTRAGNFGIDKQGNLVASGGLNVYGWENYERNTDGGYDFKTEETTIPINLFSGTNSSGKAINKKIIAATNTTNASFTGNLDVTSSIKNTNAAAATDHDPSVVFNDTSTLQIDVDNTSATYGHVTDGAATPEAVDPDFIVPYTIYDSLGNDHKINLYMWKNYSDSNGSTWYFSACDENGKAYEDPTAPAPGVGLNGLIAFDTDGRIIDGADANLGYTYNTEFTFNFTPPASAGTNSFEVEIDFSKLTQYAADNSVKPDIIDGYPSGDLVTFSVGADGVITGIYSNGRQQPLGMLALTTFDNPAGLQKVGSNLYIPTTNSGDFSIAWQPGTGDAGVLSPGTLEMSNVDLARQFTEMIITQRGFQANSRVMTTSDEILQELSNLKR